MCLILHSLGYNVAFLDVPIYRLHCTAGLPVPKTSEDLEFYPKSCESLVEWSSIVLLNGLVSSWVSTTGWVFKIEVSISEKIVDYCDESQNALGLSRLHHDDGEKTPDRSTKARYGNP